MFRTCMITSVLSQHDRRLTVRIERCWVSEWAENFFNESAKLNALLGGVCGSDVFGLRCRESDQFLLLRRPAYSPSIQNICVAGNHMSMFLTRSVLRPVLLTGRDGEQRGFGGQRDLDYSAPRVRWLCTPLCGKAEAQGIRPSKPEKKGTRPIGNS